MNTIQTTYSLENLISRVYGLFPYFEYTNGNEVIREAIDSNIGCYGKIVPNIILPVNFVVDGNIILESGKTYSYRYLIDIFSEYQYKDGLKENEFLTFMRRGFGERKVILDEIGLTDTDKHGLIPEYINLACLSKNIENLEKLASSYELTKRNTYSDCTVCEEAKRFIEYGGYKYIDYLKTLSNEARTISAEYFSYASKDSLSVSFDIPLFNRCIDLGYNTCYINQWIPGERYYCGDIVTYNGITYVCVMNEIVQNPCTENYFIDDYVDNEFYNNSGTQCQYVMCNDLLYVLNEDHDGYDGPKNVQHVDCLEVYLTCVDCENMEEYIEVNDIFYHKDPEECSYEEISVCEYTTGAYDETTHTIGFDYSHFVPLADYVQEHPLNENGTVNSDKEEGWYSSNNVFGTKYKIFIDVNSLPNEKISDYVRFIGDFYVWNGDSYVLDTNDCGIYRICGEKESVLKQFMARDSFIDLSDNSIIPDFGNDFLYLYKKGKVVNTQIKYEENGNISRFTQNILSVGDYATDLYAYGDVLYNIVVNQDIREIKFYYIVGAHLKAMCSGIELNELLENIYLYDGRFEYDENDTHGIKYVETYEYDEGSDIETLINDGNFDFYVSHYNSDVTITDDIADNYIIQGLNMAYVNIVPTLHSYDFVCMIDQNNNIIIYKWDADTTSYIQYDHVTIYDYTGKPMLFHAKEENMQAIEIGNACETKEYNFIKSEYCKDIENELDLLYAPLFKEDYLVGITYSNIENSGIYVGRGNAASIERHVKMGEVKTMEDFENFANGGFFNVTTL